jgi:hypothetical protein
MSSTIKLGISLLILAGVLGGAPKEASAQTLSGPAVYTVSGDNNNIQLYYDFNCLSSKYEFSWGYNVNTTCADDNVSGPVIETHLNSDAVPSYSTYDRVNLGRAFFKDIAFGPPAWTSVDVGVYVLTWRFSPTASDYGYSLGFTNNVASWDDYCANTIGWGNSTNYPAEYLSVYFSDYANWQTALASATGPSQHVTITCEF